ncbi:hypothetical protein BASA61_010322, partial [Batrachochytrium salamandrivorans]
MPRSKSVVDNHIEEMKLNACLTLDVWSNIKNEPIVNYMLISDSSTFFLESVSTGEQSHDAKWIAQDMGRMIDSLAGKVCGAVTDNTTTNRSAWSILKKKYPDLFFQEFAQQCKDVVSFISFHHQMKAQTSKSTADREPTWLSAASSNAWGFLEGVFRKLEKKVNTFCTASFLPGTSFKEQASRKESQQKIHDIITDGQSQQGSKGCFRFLMLEKGTKTILQFWLVDGLEFPQLRDLALQVFG